MLDKFKKEDLQKSSRKVKYNKNDNESFYSNDNSLSDHESSNKSKYNKDINFEFFIEKNESKKFNFSESRVKNNYNKIYNFAKNSQHRKSTICIKNKDYL